MLELNSGFVVLVGFGKLLLNHLQPLLPSGKIIVIEDPDIIEKRAIKESLAELTCVKSLVAARYHQSEDFVVAVEQELAGAQVLAVLPGLEYGVLGAAILAERWNLLGAGVGAARILTDKIELRKATQAAGMPAPHWAELRNAQQLADFADHAAVVLKPANRHASLGVQRLESNCDYPKAWAKTVAAQDDLLLPGTPLNWRYLAEQTLQGPEYSVEALVDHGEVIFQNITAKDAAGGLHPVELGHTVPADISPDLANSFHTAMQDLILAVNFHTGVLHAEWIVTSSGPVLIECAARIPGDSIVFLIDAAYGGDLISSMLRLLSGEKPMLPARPALASAICFLTGSPGQIKEIHGLAQVQNHPQVLRATMHLKVGDEIHSLESSWDRVGEVLTIAQTPSQAQELATQLCASIQIIVN